MKGLKTKKELSPEQREELLRTLQAGFEKNMNRHEGLEWAKVEAKLEANPEKLNPWEFFKRKAALENEVEKRRHSTG